MRAPPDCWVQNFAASRANYWRLHHRHQAGLTISRLLTMALKEGSSFSFSLFCIGLQERVWQHVLPRTTAKLALLLIIRSWIKKASIRDSCPASQPWGHFRKLKLHYHNLSVSHKLFSLKIEYVVNYRTPLTGRSSFSAVHIVTSEHSRRQH